MLDDRIIERKLLLKRTFSRKQLYKIGKTLKIPFFESFNSAWDIDYEKATLEISIIINNEQLQTIFNNYKPRTWAVFRGQYYSFENGEFKLEGSWKMIQAGIAEIRKKYGKNVDAILKCFLKATNGCTLKDISSNLNTKLNFQKILTELEKHKVIITSYKSTHLHEWKILEETAQLVRYELGIAPSQTRRKLIAPIGLVADPQREVDPLFEEKRTIERMDQEFNVYLNDLLKNRLEDVLAFGSSFSVIKLADYLISLFGSVLYFDSLLSITQQYGLADVEITHPSGRTGIRTGWNLSLFGEPGTGKSFSARDLIMGKLDSKVRPHGIPGRNRYAGGMTPARFIRIGQAYAGRVFNFIIPEFNDWFKYKGMVEPLKLAMEHGEIKYETHREIIGPYRFSGFFSVNYNVASFERGYEVTVQDPNFTAIEDRMLCRLHRLTKERFVEIAESQMRLAFGEIDAEEGAHWIQDHLALIYAIETKHHLVKNRFKHKPVMLTKKAQELLMKTRKAILSEIPHEVVRFSARLEDRAIRFAGAASLLSYFQTNLNYIPLDPDALNFALRLYVEEASVRSREEFLPEVVLGRLPLS